tara:strand:+ start:476 stop:1165 length:690 start_codon:yes stop_codon:yes gene_type:complete
MKDINDVCFIIQARMGSQRVPRKMTKPFAGTTLTDIAMAKIKECKVLKQENFFLSAYETELKDIALKHGLNIFDRSEASANSEGTPMTEMYDWWDKLPYKYCVLINACAPFLQPETIDGFIEGYLNSDSDGMFGVMEKKNYFWNDKGQSLTTLKGAVMNTKVVDVTYEAAHCLYAGRMDLIGEGIWMGDFRKDGDIELFSMPERECFDIDYDWQFEVAEKLYLANREKN